MKKRNIRHALFGFSILLLLSFLWLLTPLSPARYVQNIERSGNDVGKELFASILDIAREQGISFGVEVVDAAVRRAAIGSDDCHSLLHLLGHEAYLVYGSNIDSIMEANRGSICLGGYLHGVEAQIAAEGLFSRNVLWKFCEAMKERNLNNGPCFHGVGHGAFEFNHNVHESLAFCDALAGGPEDEMWNCYRGVFSELGNALLGIDTNTGEPIAPLVDARMPIERPFIFCDSLGATYRDSCYSQLAKVFFQSSNPIGSIRACVSAASTQQGERYCVEIISGVMGRIFLDTDRTHEMPDFINTLEVSEQKHALAGLHEAYRGYIQNGGTFSWAGFCGDVSLPDPRVQCESLADEQNSPEGATGI